MMTFVRQRLLRLLRSLPDTRWARRLAILLRRPLKYGKQREYTVDLWGMELLLRPRGNVAESQLLFTPQFLDRPEREAITALHRSTPGSFLFLDVGANIGAYTYWVCSLWQGQAEIHAFEANPDLAHRLEANLKRNRITSVTVHNVALSPQPGFLDFHLDPHNLGESRLKATGSAAGKERKIRVRGEPLSHYAAQYDRPADLLKIDIEGAEVGVLQELFDSLDPTRYPRRILSEIKPQAGSAELEDLLRQAGYQPETSFRLNRLYRLRQSPGAALHPPA